MKLRVSSRTILARPAGLWLRCFLGGAFLMLLLCGRPSVAQLVIPKPERLTHVVGVVVNPEGHSVRDAAVELVRDGQVMAATRTDDSGGFRFEHVSGTYLFRVVRTKYAPAAREIVVTDEIVTYLERKRLYVILGPGACMDECSAVLTSKRDFERTIRKNNRHP